ncbi:hypothetical protein L596_009942 [Steinernema carpocapsae]|uniref:Uncharacterized protein n=1 Tax=Steinernema carpocapsae TaxID=34508 RepID=A0A4U5PI49_STECR|nr:hypothetical protein L596_009942 [Steinernema carpocapsae]
MDYVSIVQGILMSFCERVNAFTDSIWFFFASFVFIGLCTFGMSVYAFSKSSPDLYIRIMNVVYAVLAAASSLLSLIIAYRYYALATTKEVVGDS